MQVILNSWKEIAAYIGRGVRTAQRWERDLALPVRRPRGKKRSAVIAVQSEIDAWLRRCPTYDSEDKDRSAESQSIALGWEKTHQTAHQLFSGTEVLHHRTLKLREDMQRAAMLSEKMVRNRMAGD
jgi:predicted DNA-binding transcriptional regulator AlpA